MPALIASPGQANKRKYYMTNKTTTKIPLPLEDDECIVFADWLRGQHIPHCHVANESRSSTKSAMIRGAKLKKMGQVRGVWDYEVFLPVKGVTNRVDAYQEIRIEMKRQRGGTVSPEQKQWALIYEKAGIPHAVCKGAEEAIKFVCSEMDKMSGAGFIGGQK